MKKDSGLETYRGLLISFVIVALAAALLVLPNQFHSEAGSDKKQTKKGFVNNNETRNDRLENYDIRENMGEAARNDLAKFREESGKPASAIADVRDNFVRGEEALRARIPSLKVEYNQSLRIPEVITPDVWKPQMERLSAPSSGQKNSDVLRNFVNQNNQLVGMDTYQIDQLEVSADYTNPKGNMAFAHLEQVINGIPVFQGEIKAGFTAKGEIVRVINNLAPDLDYQNLSTDFKDPLDAVQAAGSHIKHNFQSTDLARNDAVSSDLKVVFGTGDSATTAEKVYFPTETGTARAAWKVLIWQPANAYYVIVDAETGTMLWRKNITEDQNQTATYEVYNNLDAFMKVAESPAPISPGPINPGMGTQGTLLTRTNVTLTGREAPNTFNNLGWMTDGTNLTDGNNNEAGLDLVSPDGVDAPMVGTNRVFNSAWNPPPGNPAPGDSPTAPAARFGAVVQMFYAVNRYHDALYLLGFTEAARNFQNDNFGRGGVGNDRIRAEGQDFGDTNNADFSTASDGVRGRMQMYVFTGSNPDRDGTTDVDVIVHELTHGTSNRLHSNANGLTSNMASGMGEGWSDFYGHTLLAQSSDPADGIYTTGSYVTFNSFGLGSTNSYYGIRRFPKARLSFTGGPNNRPHNPLTFADLNSGCNLSDGAFSPPFVGQCDQVHNAGEIWSSHLWEVRDLMITRLGFTAGTERVLQIVTDGMKLDPINPTFTQARDSIITAAGAITLAPEASADVADVREGFRRRGMGFSAKVNAISPADVTEAFNFPNVEHIDPFSVSDSVGNNNGFPEPGEKVLLSVPVKNTTGATINNVVVNINGGTGVSYGNIADGNTVTQQIPYTVPGGVACGSSNNVQVNVSSAAGTQIPVNRSFIVGVPNPGSSSQNFDGVTAPALPANWGKTQIEGTGINWVTATSSPSSAPNSAFANDATTVNDAALVTSVLINSASAQIAFKNFYNTESGFDGMVLEYSTNNSTWTDVCPNCATICPGASCPFVSGGYNSLISSDFSSPISGRRAWSGNAGSYLDTVVNLPASLNGKVVNLRWRLATDESLGAPGVNIDNIAITGGNFINGYSCGPITPTNTSKFDYDGDGKTDISIFRPNVGQWWYLRSTDNVGKAFEFGQGSDKIVPADFTGDGITDIAFWRPSTGQWFVLRSEDNSFFAFDFGANGDIPIPGDFDGDGKADAAVFRPSNATYFIMKSSDSGLIIQQFGQNGDVPIIEDYDGDGKDDIANFRPSVAEWYIQRSTAGYIGFQFGTPNDTTPTPADFTGDGKADIAFFKPSATGGANNWFVLRSEDFSFYAFPFGVSTDIPVPGDYDGDGMADPAVYRPSNFTWYLQQTTAGFTAIQFGVAGDIPTPSAFIP